MRKLLSLTCVLTLALVAAGCGASAESDGSDSTEAGPTTTEAGPTTSTEAGPTTTNRGGAGASADDFAAAFVTNLSSGTEQDGDLVIAADEAACVGPRILDAITVETLEGNDVTPEDVSNPSWDGSNLGLDADQGQLRFDAFGACDVDLVAMFARSLTAGLTAQQQSCAEENVDPDLAEALLVKTFSTGESDAEFQAVIADLTSKCELPG